MEASFKIAVACILLMFTNSVYAAPDVLVQSVQMPAWLQRDSVFRPLTVGMLLNNDDKLTTGMNGEITLKVADATIGIRGTDVWVRTVTINA